MPANQIYVDAKKQNNDNSPMNWQTILSEIRAHGLSQMEVARRLGRSQAWVAALAAAKYKDVSWTDGQALLALHAELSQKEAA